MKIQHISAVTLAVQDMAQSVDFYRKLGLELLYGGEQASFTSFRAGGGGAGGLGSLSFMIWNHCIPLSRSYRTDSPALFALGL